MGQEVGGLTVLGNAKETLMRNKAGRMFRLGIVEILALHIVNCALNYGKFYSGEAFLAVELACVVAIVVLISYLLRVRGRTIVIHSDWSKERIWNRTTGSPKTWLRFLRIQSKKKGKRRIL